MRFIQQYLVAGSLELEVEVEEGTESQQLEPMSQLHGAALPRLPETNSTRQGKGPAQS